MQPVGVRSPVVAGRFYPADADALGRDVDAYLAGTQRAVAGDVLACVAPHAGYMFSGPVAGAVYASTPRRARYLILGPNHFGNGVEPLALDRALAWRTPLGDVAVHREFSRILKACCQDLEEDDEAHGGEHSIEVQLPFLQRHAPSFTFVPVAIGAAGFAALDRLGRGVAKALAELGEPVLIVASSDMNHYEPDAVTRAKDAKAIDKILALDPAGLYETVRREGISMCGIGPTVAMLVAARERGAKEAVLVRYATSADAGGGRGAVVGYAGIVIR